MSFVEPAATPANWYTDPYGRAVQRYWNGAAWTAYVVDANGQQRVDDPAVQAPPTPSPTGTASGHGVVINNVVHASQQPQALVTVGMPGLAAQKSTGVAFVLTFFFGPLGMFYSTVSGAVIMLVLSLILVPATLGLAALILWPVSIIWGVSAVNTHNQQLVARMAAPQPIHYGAPHLAQPGYASMAQTHQQVPQQTHAALPAPPLPPATGQ